MRYLLLSCRSLLINLSFVSHILDINPSHRRNLFDSPCNHFIRLSFGPPLPELDRGLDGIQRLVNRAKAHYEEDGHLMNGMGKGYAVSEKESQSKGSLDAPSSGS